MTPLKRASLLALGLLMYIPLPLMLTKWWLTEYDASFTYLGILAAIGTMTFVLTSCVLVLFVLIVIGDLVEEDSREKARAERIARANGTWEKR